MAAKLPKPGIFPVVQRTYIYCPFSPCISDGFHHVRVLVVTICIQADVGNGLPVMSHGFHVLEAHPDETQGARWICKSCIL